MRQQDSAITQMRDKIDLDAAISDVLATNAFQFHSHHKQFKICSFVLFHTQDYVVVY